MDRYNSGAAVAVSHVLTTCVRLCIQSLFTHPPPFFSAFGPLVYFYALGCCFLYRRAFMGIAVVRQTLQHWAYRLNEKDYLAGAQRVKTHGAAYVPRAELADVIETKST